MSKVDKKIIAYCGLNCKKCFAFELTVSEKAKSLRRELRRVKLKNSWNEIPFLGEYESFKKSLDGLAMLRCTKMCRGGGGNPWCKIRKCCKNKNFEGCWKCADMEICQKLHKEYLINLKKIKKLGIDQFIKQ
jgi:hypothetical protein